MDSQLQLCDHLYQAAVTCQHGCHTPANFNSILLQALQELLQELRHPKEVSASSKWCCLMLSESTVYRTPKLQSETWPRLPQLMRHSLHDVKHSFSSVVMTLHVMSTYNMLVAGRTYSSCQAVPGCILAAFQQSQLSGPNRSLLYCR